MRESDGIDETDLAVIHAIERSPRASWAVIGSVAGIDASTAARRWERLESSGTAWVTCYPLLQRSVTAAIVELRCAAGTPGRVAEFIARDPQAHFVDITSGDADILVTAATNSFRSLSSYVMERLGRAPDVTSVRTRPILTVHSEGTFVGAGSLDRAALSRLPTVKPGPIIGASYGIDDLDNAICLALSRDGRQSFTALGAAVGTSEASVRRRMRKLTDLGALRMMVEVAAAQTSTPHTAWYSARIAPRHLSTAAGIMAQLPNIKAVVSVAGPDNLVFKAMFRDPADLEAFDTDLNERLPDMDVTDRKIVLRPVRLSSRLVDADGYARELVSVDISQEPEATTA